MIKGCHVLFFRIYGIMCTCVIISTTASYWTITFVQILPCETTINRLITSVQLGFDASPRMRLCWQGWLQTIYGVLLTQWSYVFLAPTHQNAILRTRLLQIYVLNCLIHDDVIKWKHFPRYWPIVRSPVNSPHKGQWREALIFSLICAWTNGWVNNRGAGDLWRNRAHYDVTIMIKLHSSVCTKYTYHWPPEKLWAHRAGWLLVSVGLFCSNAILKTCFEHWNWCAIHRKFHGHLSYA